ncbi:TIGR00297 family protein [Granulicella pectinivorans]|uniref:TIGR00297 family protein n=2 Tax=Granulicella pectinivorans TaxID=474950 RepID=A0A1I6N0Y8_9BACT|nr:TIGR00297 family protein [Granulicella pectinivorans]
MHKESRDAEYSGGGGPERQRVISAAWDRRQSFLMTLGMGLLLTAFIGLRFFTLVGIQRPPVWFFWALAFSTAFSLLVWRLRSATPAAAALGGVLCLNLLSRQYYEVSWTRTAFPELALLFFLTFAATRYGRLHKEAKGLTDRRGRSGRQVSQVMANLGVAGFFAMQHETGFFAAGLAALAEATADTVSSELGQVFGGRTILITSGKSVPPGTNGAVSMAGTLCGVLAAALIAGLATALGAIDARVAVLVFVCGVSGLLFDSLLGATVERWGWIGNDLVNFASTCLAAYLMIRFFHILEPPQAFW